MKVVVRLDKQQAKHISKLADAGNCSEAEVLIALIEMDRSGENTGVPEEVKTLVAKLNAVLNTGNGVGVDMSGLTGEYKQLTRAELAAHRAAAEAAYPRRKVGRPRAFTPEQEREILSLKNGDMTEQQIADYMRDAHGISRSRGAVRRVILRSL